MNLNCKVHILSTPGQRVVAQAHEHPQPDCQVVPFRHQAGRSFAGIFFGTLGMLRSLDLFSGVGGITHALRGLAHPVMYCEKDPECTKVLATLIRNKKLPAAPVCEDVAKLTTSNLSGKVDIIVAGFPCQGFSLAGDRQGLEHFGSSLFSHVARLARTVRPPLLFLENVAAIVGSADFHHIVRTLNAAGYDLYWSVWSAYDVGSPQGRARWFCLGVRQGLATNMTIKPSAPYSRHSWASEPCPRMVARTALPLTNDRRRRLRNLGNSVVPDCVRAAFLSLFTGCTTPVLTLLKQSSIGGPVLHLTPPKPRGPLGNKSKSYACVIKGAWSEIPKPPGMLGRPSLGLVLVPRVYKPKRGTKLQEATSGMVLKPVTIDKWATPRHGNGAVGSHSLTNRGTKDLATQLRFEKSTPEHLRPGVTSAEWVEWLMGFPKNWTRVP